MGQPRLPVPYRQSPLGYDPSHPLALVQLGQPHPQIWMARLLSPEKRQVPTSGSGSPCRGIALGSSCALRLDTAMEKVPKTLRTHPLSLVPPGGVCLRPYVGGPTAEGKLSNLPKEDESTSKGSGWESSEDGRECHRPVPFSSKVSLLAVASTLCKAGSNDYSELPKATGTSTFEN